MKAIAATSCHLRCLPATMGAAQVSGRFELKAIRKGSPLVDRAVRTLAVAALIFLGIYAPLLHGLLAPPPLTSFTGDVYDDGPPAVLVEFVGQSGFYLSLIAGVIVLVLCLQRNQRRWVVILVAILGLAAYGPPLSDPRASLGSRRSRLSDICSRRPNASRRTHSTGRSDICPEEPCHATRP
jgi:hypothetical protein